MKRKEETIQAAINAHLDIYEKSVDVFIKGAEWADRTMLDKVCKWLKSYRQESNDGTGYIAGVVNDKTIEDLGKAMVEE